MRRLFSDVEHFFIFLAYFSSVVFTAVFYALFGTLVCFCGLVLYAFYETQGCDPLRASFIANSNQVCFSITSLFISVCVMQSIQTMLTLHKNNVFKGTHTISKKIEIRPRTKVI